jgi:hypothetical protein
VYDTFDHKLGTVAQARCRTEVTAAGSVPPATARRHAPGS